VRTEATAPIYMWSKTGIHNAEKSISFRQGASMLSHWTEGGFMVNHLEGPTLTENDNNREKTEVHIMGERPCSVPKPSLSIISCLMGA
jgi:hypothetical protein